MAGDAIMTKKFLNDTGLQHVFSLITSFVKNYASPKTHNHDGVYAKSSHNHNTSNITSGTFPIGRGGTGASNSKGAQYNIMKDILEGTVNASDSDVFVLKHHTPSATDGALLTRSAAQVWAWIKSKCDGLYQPRGSYASSSHTHTIANVSNLQSTLDSKASVSHTHSNATATASGFMSNTDKSKLDGVSAGANKTIVDASFSTTSTNPVQNKVVKAALDTKASSSHTHTTSQVSGLDATLSGKAPTSHTHTIASVTNLQSQLDSKVPVGRLINKKPLSTDITLSAADVKADAAGAADNALSSAKQYTDTVAAGKAAKSHMHDATNITTGTLSQDRLPLVPVAKGGTGKTNGKDAANYFINSLEEGTAIPTDSDKILTQYVGGGTANTTYVRRPLSTLWSYIKPKCDAVYQAKGSYAASSHTHAISNITNLQAQLDGKQAKGSYAASSHTHTIANVTNLQSTLDSKQPKGDYASASHSHNSIKDAGDGRNITFNYSANGATDASWYAVWNGSELKSMSKADMKKSLGVVNMDSALVYRHHLNSSYDMNNIRQTGIYVVENSMPKNYCGQAWTNVIVLGIAGWTRQYAITSSNTYIRTYGGEPAIWSNWTNSELFSYPVGAVYISWSSTSPASLFGGSWTAITGRFPYFNAGTGQGGSNSHTLSVNELASHSHQQTKFYIYDKTYWSVNGHGNAVPTHAVGGNTINTPFMSSGTLDWTNNAGSNWSHNNMPAYQTLYAWRRTG